jgi:uncharacterized protein (DUF1684 family)
MTRLAYLIRLGLLALVVLANGCAKIDESTYVAEVENWHAERLAGLRNETGWLSLVGLHPLAQGINTLGSGPDNTVVMTAAAPVQLGTLTVAGEDVSFTAAPGVTVGRRVDGMAGETPFAGGRLQSDGQGTPDVLAAGSLVFHVIRRGEAHYLRVKDRQSPVLRDFQGIDCFPVDPVWRVTAQLEGEAGTLRVANVLGQIAEEVTPGTLVFRLAGQDCRLRPTGEPGGPLFIVFADASNGHETYPGGRFLSVEAPDQEGKVVLDFNRAYNPPCVFTEYATCPLPGPDNALPLAVTAGEKTWGTGH